MTLTFEMSYVVFVPKSTSMTSGTLHASTLAWHNSNPEQSRLLEHGVHLVPASVKSTPQYVNGGASSDVELPPSKAIKLNARRALKNVLVRLLISGPLPPNMALTIPINEPSV